MQEISRVLHLVNGEHYAGAERVQDLLAGKIKDFGHEMGFVCLKQGMFAESRQSQDTPLIRFPMRSNLDIRVAQHVSDYAMKYQYSLIHTHTPRSALIGMVVSLRTGLPMVHHVHSPSIADTENALRNFRNSALEKVCLMRAARLIPVSASLEKYLLDKGHSASKIRMVANGVPIRENASGLRYEGKELVLGTVALFRPRKGTEVLLRAIARLRNSGLDVRLHAVGQFETGAYEESVMQLVERLGLQDAITWTGFTSDVFAEFSKMHVFVLPSLYGEGMPMVVLEAMSTGLPVISTTVEGIPEVVREGHEGLLVAPESVKDIAEAIRKAVDGSVDLAAMGESGLQRQRDHFSDVSMARGVAAVYQELLQ